MAVSTLVRVRVQIWARERIPGYSVVKRLWVALALPVLRYGPKTKLGHPGLAKSFVEVASAPIRRVGMFLPIAATLS